VREHGTGVALLEERVVRPCAVLLFLARRARSEDLTGLLGAEGPWADVPLVMFSTGEDTPILEPDPALLMTLVKMVEHNCAS
jgi:hypothetical protein